MDTQFDYNDIKNEHKIAAEECAKLVDPMNPHMASLIREKFNIALPKRIPLEESEFYKVASGFGLNVVPQGYMVGPDTVQVPMVAVVAEITKFDDFLSHYKDLLCK
jgi:hypothetical protein